MEYLLIAQCIPPARHCIWNIQEVCTAVNVLTCSVVVTLYLYMYADKRV